MLRVSVRIGWVELGWSCGIRIALRVNVRFQGSVNKIILY